MILLKSVHTCEEVRVLVATEEARLTLSDTSLPEAVALGVGSPSLSVATAKWVFSVGSLSLPEARSTALLLVSLVLVSVLLDLQQTRDAVPISSCVKFHGLQPAKAKPISTVFTRAALLAS